MIARSERLCAMVLPRFSSIAALLILYSLLLLGLAPSGSAQGPYQWKIKNVDGRDYVTASDIHRFYRFDKKHIHGKSVSFHHKGASRELVMAGQVGSQTLTINQIKFIMSFPMILEGSEPMISRLDLCKLIDPVLRPADIRNSNVFNTVVLDPGHGGHDSGARCSLGKEADFALETAKMLKMELEKRGYRVYMTRSDDRYITLGNRVKAANKFSNAIFVSLHYNSGQSRAYGIETFALSPQGSSSVYGARSSDYKEMSGNKRDSENIALATAVHAAAMHHISTIDRGIKRARWSVLTGLQLPGILFEGGFLSNPAEARKVASPSHRRRIAQAIATGIDNYRKALSQ